MNTLVFRFRLQFTRLYWGIVGPVRRVYRYVIRPETRGAKMIISYGNEILLVRLNYAHRLWTFPGGGVNRKEEWKAAALREAKEETGLSLPDAEELFEYSTIIEHRTDTVHVFRAEVASKFEPTVDGIEIAEARWFSLENLPSNRAPRVDYIISRIKLEPSP